MKIVIAISALLLIGSLSGCLKVDAGNASKEWSEVGESWADAFKDQEEGQSQGEGQ